MPRFRFSLLMLFWFVTFAAIGCAMLVAVRAKPLGEYDVVNTDRGFHSIGLGRHRSRLRPENEPCFLAWIHRHRLGVHGIRAFHRPRLVGCRYASA